MQKYLKLLLCATLIINFIFLTSCAGKNKAAIVADTKQEGITVGGIDSLIDTDTRPKYTEPEYTLTKTEEKIAKKASEYMNDLDFSGSVLLGIGDHIIYRESFGYSHKRLKTNNKNETVYQIASLTKQFTGTAILLLQEQGKLNVTDKLSKYLPDFKHGNKLTIENLLFMTSGLQDFAEAYILDSLKANKEYPIGAMYDLIKDYQLWSTPGMVYEYCNTNFYILGMIIEKASGMSYEEYLSKYIFEPLHMDTTGLDTGMVTAKGYSWGNEFSCVYNKSIFYSAGAICSTTEDMFRWLRGFWNGKVISKKSIEYILQDKSKLGYSCGFVVSDEGIMRHSGNLGGYKTFAMINYEDDIKVIILSNNEQQLSAEIGLHLNDIAKMMIG